MRKILAASTVAGLAAAAFAQTGGQVNGSGATLFVDFFTFPAWTNDFIDVDGDGIAGPLGPPDFADQLANSNPSTFAGPYGPGTGQTFIVSQYRSVGSIRGYTEFVNYQICGDLPESAPSEQGIINSLEFAALGASTWVGPPASCTDDTDGDGIANASGTPLCWETVDYSNTDVPSIWAVRSLNPAGAVWSANPGSPGYGNNPNLDNTGVQSNLLAPLEVDCDNSGTIEPNEALNVNQGAPDSRTIFDTTIAFSPVTGIANRGTGVSEVSMRQLQHLFVTGRMPNGTNYAAATRDAGSGTRNGWANPLGIDPSWCVGDHVGERVNSSSFTNLGPDHQVNNCGGSSIMENAVQNRRLAIGFTGAFGGSRSINDAISGRYELLGVRKDIGSPQGTAFVRPSLTSVLFNDDPDTGWQIGGLQTFSTVGEPDANRDPNDPLYDGVNPPVDRDLAAALINNLTSSINEFAEPNDPNDISDQTGMPGEVLALSFALEASVSSTPTLADPTIFVANPTFNAGLQNFIAANSDVNPTPAYGSVNAAGRVPVRTANPIFGDPNSPDATAYSDGSTDGNYFNYFTDGPNNPTIVGGTTLNARNALAADFNNDGARTTADIAPMIAAVADPATAATSGAGSSAGDPLVPEIIGDLDGDGNLTAEDVRYFADGLVLSGGSLDRTAGFVAVDTASANYFGTTLATPCGYVAGGSKADIAGAGSVTKGAMPTGQDGVVDAIDLDYIAGNFGDWSDLDQAVNMDLSADMNGDLVVDADDITDVLVNVLSTRPGDFDLDGDVDLTDLATVLANFGGAGAYADGDSNGDGAVDLSDLANVLANFGFSC